jgi:hypothetical protein
LREPSSVPQLANIATDGETYGHHHRHGEMALAYALDLIERKKSARITNYAEFLSKHPPEWEAQIYEQTAWSCVHGVERWRSDCGCNSGRVGWNQKWRKPLREALDWLRDTVNPSFELVGKRLLGDPWAARDAYIHVVLDRSPEVRERFGREHFARSLKDDEQVTVWKLMELQRHAMLMYTSCGWFFDDLSGIETVQVIEYAGRVVQLAEQVFGQSIEQQFLERLSLAKGNLPASDGAEIYRHHVKPSIVDLEKVGAHYSISSLFAPYGECTDIFSYSARKLDYHTADAGKLRMALGQASFTSKVTQESEILTFWVVHFGDHNVAGGVSKLENRAEYVELVELVREASETLDIPEVVRLLDKRFGDKTYSLRSLFRDEQRRILRTILSSTVVEAEAAYLQLYEHHAALMRFVSSLGTPIPREFVAAMEYAVNGLLRRACSSEELDAGRIGNLLREAKINNVSIDKTTLEFSLRHRLEILSKTITRDPTSQDRVDTLRQVLRIVRQMPFPVSMWTVQNDIYKILCDGVYRRLRSRAERGEPPAQKWLESYLDLCKLLSIAVE